MGQRAVTLHCSQVSDSMMRAGVCWKASSAHGSFPGQVPSAESHEHCWSRILTGLGVVVHSCTTSGDRRLMVQGQHRQKLARPCLTNKLKAKRAGGVAQVTTKKAKKKKKKPNPNWNVQRSKTSQSYKSVTKQRPFVCGQQPPGSG
jgi:hypothetical protein